MKTRNDREASGDWTDGIIGTGPQVAITGTFFGIEFTGWMRRVYGGISIDFDTPITYLSTEREGAYLTGWDIQRDDCSVKVVEGGVA